MNPWTPESSTSLQLYVDHSLRITALRRVRKRPDVSEMIIFVFFCLLKVKIQTDTQVQSIPLPLKVVMWLQHVQHNHKKWYTTPCIMKQTPADPSSEREGHHHILTREYFSIVIKNNIEQNKKSVFSVSKSFTNVSHVVHKSLHWLTTWISLRKYSYFIIIFLRYHKEKVTWGLWTNVTPDPIVVLHIDNHLDSTCVFKKEEEKLCFFNSVHHRQLTWNY